MYYHASPFGGITQLKPRVSNHGIPLVYFSKKRENVLVYLSNAVEKYCKETGFLYEGIYQKWGPYGFNRDGRQRLEEYYPNALISTYQGVSGYIAGSEFIPDAYEAILQAEREGLLSVVRYEELSEKAKEWNEKTIREEYENASEHPEYRHFLKGNFPGILKD